MQIALVGPTAVGKTAVGILLARHLRGEIISADSMQVYRGMDVGTAKPNAMEQAAARFHLIDVVDPDMDWTLADVQNAGAAAEADIAERGRLPLIVGGTGLYIRALTTRLDIPVAPPNEDFRQRWRDIAAVHGNNFVHAELAKVDADAAAKIHVNDLKRVIRALEVYDATGTPMSALHAMNREAAGSGDAVVIGLLYTDRRALYERIEARVDAMMSDGLLAEVTALAASGYGRHLKSMQSLGYRQICNFLNGDCDLETAVADIKRETRHFARRQLIWFRGDARVQWIAADGLTCEAIAEQAAGIISRALASLASVSV